LDDVIKARRSSNSMDLRPAIDAARTTWACQRCQTLMKRDPKYPLCQFLECPECGKDHFIGPQQQQQAPVAPTPGAAQ
jgi:hypothetical protein